jgi:hypothetical protein
VLRSGEDVPGGAGDLFTLQVGVTAFTEGKPRLRLATIGFVEAKIIAEARVFDGSNTLPRDNVLNIGASDSESSFDAGRLLAGRVARFVIKTSESDPGT